MGFVKEPIGIDLVVEPSALTTEDRHQLSAIIAQYKLTKEIPQLSQKKIRPTRTKTGKSLHTRAKNKKTAKNNLRSVNK